MLPKDPTEALKGALSTYLSGPVHFDASLAPDLAWRPHVLEETSGRAWYVLPQPVDSDDWIRRLARARDYSQDLLLGVCAPLTVLLSESTLLRLDELHVQLLRSDLTEDGAEIVSDITTVCDFIYENSIQLKIESVRVILDRNLARARAETDANKKGVLLEVLAAVMFSQVRGFRVKDVGVSRRSQQLDVTVLNSNVGSPLFQKSPLIVVEAKNWNEPVGSVQYGWLYRKLTTSRGRAKLGFLITTGRFTKGVYTESIRDSKEEHLIVLLDGETLPTIWNDHIDITKGMEAAVYAALMDHA